MSTVNPIEQTYRELTAAGRKITKLFLGNPNGEGFHFPPEILERAYQAYFRRQDYHPHPKGLQRAREAVRDYYLEGEIKVDPENILITSGSSESFFYLFSLLAQVGDNLLTPNPSYPLFDHIAELARVELRHYPLAEERGWEIDLEELKRRTDARTKAVILVSPNNPTGAVASEEQIQGVVRWVNERGMALICDEVFSEFYFGKGRFPRPMAVANPLLCFTLNGLSKMFALPGLKLSWIAVTGEKGRVAQAVDRLETMNDTFLTCHTPIQEALPALFSEGSKFLADYRKDVAFRRELALELLKSPSVEVNPPQGGFYLMARIKKQMSMSEEEFVIRLMKERNLFVHPGYFYDAEHGPHFVISHLLQPEKMKACLPLLVDFIEKI